MTHQKKLLSIFIFIFALNEIFAQGLPSGIVQKSTVEGITEYHLSNGVESIIIS